MENESRIKILEKKIREYENLLRKGYHSPSILRNAVIDMKIQINQLKTMEVC